MCGVIYFFALVIRACIVNYAVTQVSNSHALLYWTIKKVSFARFSADHCKIEWYFFSTFSRQHLLNLSKKMIWFVEASSISNFLVCIRAKTTLKYQRHTGPYIFMNTSPPPFQKKGCGIILSVSEISAGYQNHRKNADSALFLFRTTDSLITEDH